MVRKREQCASLLKQSLKVQRRLNFYYGAKPKNTYGDATPSFGRAGFAHWKLFGAGDKSQHWRRCRNGTRAKISGNNSFRGIPHDIEADKDLRFYILGLSLNKARLALRFWYACSVCEILSTRLNEHSTIWKWKHRKRYSISRDMAFAASRKLSVKTKDISPVLGGALIVRPIYRSELP